MDKIKYIGLDVHRDTISAAVLNESGRLIQQSVLMTRAAAPRPGFVQLRMGAGCQKGIPSSRTRRSVFT